ncbi:hypothetical protein GCM10020001_095140 [Nonomuraea salmonea]
MLVELARQMADECPDAWLLSCSDPMAMTGWAVHEATGYERFAGLCHAVCDTHAYLADLVGRDEDEVSFLSAGLNHQSFVLRFEAGGRSLYPELDAVLEADPQLRRHVRAELYRTFGYFPTQSSEHAAEYVPWIMRHPDETARLGVPVEEYLRRVGKSLHLYEETRRALSAGHPLLIRWQHQEPAAAMILAMLTGEEKEIYVNVANRGLIGNLPEGCCVEVPAVVGAAGARPRAVGDLPVQLAALNRTFLNVVELTVRAALDGDRSHVYHAAMLDPNTAATLALPAIKALCDELIEAHGDLLPPGGPCLMESMPTEVRRERMLALLTEQEFARVAELAEAFGVSSVTVRADLDALEEQGKVRRVRGGAMAAGPAPHVEPSFELSLGTAAVEKSLIAKVAARLVTSGESVLMGGGHDHVLRGARAGGALGADRGDGVHQRVAYGAGAGARVAPHLGRGDRREPAPPAAFAGRSAGRQAA